MSDQELFGGRAVVDVEFDLLCAGEGVLDSVLVGDVDAAARLADADEPAAGALPLQGFVAEDGFGEEVLTGVFGVEGVQAGDEGFEFGWD